MTKSQFFAVSQFLTDWPDGLSYSSILDAVAEDNSCITRWEKVETWDAEELAEAIDMLELAFSRAVADILNEEKNPQPSDALNPYFADVSQQLQGLSIFSNK
jgi:hypothetical protein